MKNLILTKFLTILATILFFSGTTFADDYPNIPKELNMKSYCDKSGAKFGHVIVVIDLTSDLQKPQIDFIKDQVFSEEFYTSYDPFTKFSYLLIDNNKPQEQVFKFSKCRPKTGNKRFRPNEAASFRENVKVLEKFSNDFFTDANKLHGSIFKNKKSSNNSFIYETIAYIFQNPKSDFDDKHGRRDIILVSDLMQHSERLSFYKACNASSSNAKCPNFNTFMNNLSDKDYLTATAPKGKNVNLKIIYLNNRYETNKEIDRSLKELWKDYFKSREFENIKVISQLDIN